MSIHNGYIEAGGPVKILKKNQRFNLSDQCLSDELKFVAVCEMILETNKVYQKNKMPQQRQNSPGGVQFRHASKVRRMISDLDDIALKSTEKGTIETQKTEAVAPPPILRD